MLKIFQEELLITIGIFGFMGISVFVQLLLGILYQNMIRETDNMATTENRLLKQCKLKFENCYQLNNGVANIPVFVDKFLNRLTFGTISFETLYHLSGQSILLSVICAGVGICREVAKGRSLGAVLPFYIACFLGLYLFFSVSSVVDIKNKRRILKVNLIDYLENHLSARIGVTEDDMEMLYGSGAARPRRAVGPSSGGRGKGGTVAGAMERKADLPAMSGNLSAAKLDSVRISDEELADLIREFC